MASAEKLQLTTPSELEVVLTRSFDAPRHLVFDAWTRPEFLRRWLEANGRLLEVCESDLRVGGAYHFVWRGAGKKDVGMHGVYREIVAPERLVLTEAWEDWPVGEIVVTTIMVEQAGKTTVSSTMRYPSQEVRDSVLKAGLAGGADDAYSKLDELLAVLLQKERVS